jgi:hypothetical protein
MAQDSMGIAMFSMSKRMEAVRASMRANGHIPRPLAFLRHVELVGWPDDGPGQRDYDWGPGKAFTQIEGRRRMH